MADRIIHSFYQDHPLYIHASGCMADWMIHSFYVDDPSDVAYILSSRALWSKRKGPRVVRIMPYVRRDHHV